MGILKKVWKLVRPSPEEIPDGVNDSYAYESTELSKQVTFHLHDSSKPEQVFRWAADYLKAHPNIWSISQVQLSHGEFGISLVLHVNDMDSLGSQQVTEKELWRKPSKPRNRTWDIKYQYRKRVRQTREKIGYWVLGPNARRLRGDRGPRQNRGK